MFDDTKVVGFTNEPREEENDFLVDKTFDDETNAEDNENIVKLENKDERTETEVKSS